MRKSERAQIVLKILNKTYPKTPIPLDHKDNFTLLVAVLLSAQCTDERVNQVTPKLFKIASNPQKMSKLSRIGYSMPKQNSHQRKCNRLFSSSTC